jgi:hypothetical protein
VFGQLWSRCRTSAGLQPFGDLAVQAPPPQPGDFAIHRFADERVPEAGLARPYLQQEARFQRLTEPLVAAGQLGRQGQVYLRAGHGGNFQCLARQRREGCKPQEDGVAHGLGQGQVLGPLQVQARGSRPQALAGPQRRRYLFDKERHALGLGMQAGGQKRAEGLTQLPRRQRRRVPSLQGRQPDLAQMALAAQRAAHAPQRVPAREVVATIRSNDQQGTVLQVRGQGGQGLQCGAVGPVQVIQEDSREPSLAQAGQGAADRLQERGCVASGRRRAELG